MWTLSSEFYTYKSENLIYVNGVSKIGMFRLEETLLTSRNASYNVLSDPAIDNYIWLTTPGSDSDIFETLKDLKRKGYVIIILANHVTRVSKNFAKIEAIQEDMAERLGWSPHFVISLNRYWKIPTTRPFNAILRILGTTVNELDKKYLNQGVNFFHCGFCCGKDDPFPHFRVSSSDRDFAENITMMLYINDASLSSNDKVCKFIRPTDLFPHRLIEVKDLVKERSLGSSLRPNHRPELVILVGTSNGGRCEAAAEFKASGYSIIDYNLFNNVKRLYTAVEAMLCNGHSVVVNAFNYSKSTREGYVALAEKYDADVRVLWFIRSMKSPDRDEMEHNSIYTQKFDEPSEDEAPLEIIY